MWSAIDVVISRTLHNRRLIVSRYTFITQTYYCDMSTESQDDHIRSLISNSFGELTTNIAAVVDNRLSEFKRQLDESQDEAAETSTAKGIKLMQEPLIKSDGNKQQFQHELNVLGKMEAAFSALDQHKYDKAKQALSEGIELVKFRLKLIRIADKSECGWKTVNEYVADELADNSEDEKRLYRSEQRAQRKIRKTRLNPSRSTTSKNVASNHNQSPFSPAQFNAAHESPAK